MNPFAIGRVGGSMDIQDKRKAKPREGPARRDASGKRLTRMVVGGEVVYLNARAARITRLVRKALKGFDVPPA